jgi:hypothetical protein
VNLVWESEFFCEGVRQSGFFLVPTLQGIRLSRTSQHFSSFASFATFAAYTVFRNLRNKSCLSQQNHVFRSKKRLSQQILVFRNTFCLSQQIPIPQALQAQGATLFSRLSQPLLSLAHFPQVLVAFQYKDRVLC